MKRLTDEEVLLEYLELQDGEVDPKYVPALATWVTTIRRYEPKINSGIHLVDYCAIPRERTMEEHYGSDYFAEST